MNKILVIDDQESMRDTIRLFLEDKNNHVITASGGKEGIDLFETEHPDVIICDLKMPRVDGLEVLQILKSKDHVTPVIIMTAYEDINSTIKTMQLGAYDYLEKPFKIDLLKALISHAIASRKSGENTSDTISACNEDIYQHIENSLVGKTAVMRELIKQIGLVSMSKTTVLLEGESGTGKEVIARVIHNCGITKDHPFIGVNCTALSPSLLESELFGHVKGSFTGAYKTKKGKFDLADEGTLFLDEISELSNEIQVKLLRVLQERKFERVGGENTIPVNARIIAATNCNLARLVRTGKFRSDFYHRLKVFKIEVPPLRKRKEDIPALAIYLLGKISNEIKKNVVKIPFDSMELLKSNDWPGNVRELENTLRRAAVLSKGEYIEKEDIYFDSDNEGDNEFEPKKKNMVSLAETEKKHIEYILNEVNWNKHKACEILAITKPTLLKKIKEYNLRPETNN